MPRTKRRYETWDSNTQKGILGIFRKNNNAEYKEACAPGFSIDQKLNALRQTFPMELEDAIQEYERLKG